MIELKFNRHKIIRMQANGLPIHADHAYIPTSIPGQLTHFNPSDLAQPIKHPMSFRDALTNLFKRQ